jgi:hypothetical protein
MKLIELLNFVKDCAVKTQSSIPYICGGLPRDKVLNRVDFISDIDLTTGDASVHALATEVAVQLSKKFNVKTKVMDDGHRTLFLDNIKMDFSSNYNEPNIDNILKGLNIAKPTDLQKEMYSRDFTCNALLMTVDLKSIKDITNNGMKDISNKIIKTNLSPEITLTTNKNRAIRAIYLASKLDFNLDEQLFNYIKNNPEIIKFSSEHTLIKKTNDAFINNPKKAFQLINDLNLWSVIPMTDIVKPFYKKSLQKSASSFCPMTATPIDSMQEANLVGGFGDNAFPERDSSATLWSTVDFGRPMETDEITVFDDPVDIPFSPEEPPMLDGSKKEDVDDRITPMIDNFLDSLLLTNKTYDFSKSN